MKRIVAAVSLVFLAACSEELVCPQGETACGGRCVSLLTDARNCGACGNACDALELCSAGSCTCEPGIDTCGGACTDLARDPANCGACGAACGDVELCATDVSGTACVTSCPGTLTACGRTCVDLAADRYHCGACGNACASGENCRGGACRADIQVACYATNEVVPVTVDLAPAGDARGTPSGPGSIEILGGAVYAAQGWPSAAVSILPLDPGLPARHVAVAGSDLQYISAHENAILVTNAAMGTLLVMTASGEVLDEIPLPDQQSYPNPHGFDLVGSTAYVALYGSGPSNGQKIATVDLSSLAACASPDPAAPPCDTGGACPEGRGCVDGLCRLRCGRVTGEIDLLAVSGTSDAPGLPFPSQVLAVGGRVYVVLANLREASCGTGCIAYSEPAGSGKLAVIDPAAGNAVSVVDLGQSCKNPGALALAGSTLWVSCGSYGFPDIAPGTLLPVDLSKTPESPGTPLDASMLVPGKLSFCGGKGYVTDQASGAVMRFDPVGRTLDEPVVVCPTSVYGWAWAADVACSE